MYDGECKVSIIVPVYNVEEYLRRCLDSILAQTIEKSSMEVLLIDDGSLDNSSSICDIYAQSYPEVIKVWHNKNEGAGNARNFGIHHAKGKYIMYLDSDDEFSPDTVRACVEFFEEFYDDIDMVTYKDQSYKKGMKLPLHYRYGYLKHKGIYDLEKYPYITQTRLNICVKNLNEDTPVFSPEMKDMHEDQEYILRVLSDKMKIGYVDKIEYKYNKDNDSSIVATKFNPINLFEVTLNWFEKVFSQYSENVPAYVQGLFVNDCSWKVKENIFFPYHFNKEDFNVAIGRLKALWNRIDVEVLLAHPQIDTFHKHFWLSFKENNDIAVIPDYSGARITSRGKIIYTRKKMELVLTRFEVRDGIIDFIAYLKSPIFNYISEEPKIYIIKNGDFENAELMSVNIAAESMYRCRTMTNRFFEFRFRESAKLLSDFSVIVVLDGIDYETDYWFTPKVAFNKAKKKNSFISENYKITFLRDKFTIIHLNYMVTKSKIWLYSDASLVETDNAYFQFQHDFYQNDDITRYYITSIEKNRWEDFFKDEQIKFIIERNSEMHKVCYLHAEKLLTSYVNNNDFVAASPFSKEEESEKLDSIHHEIIYLQHGVLHADYRQQYCLEVNIAHKIVVSSQFEIDNMINKYHYNKEDLIDSGMARYDHIDKEIKPMRKILFAPSWRGYFAKRNDMGEWVLEKERFVNSNYYKGIIELLESSELIRLLEKSNYVLDVKLHPILQRAVGLFGDFSNRINIVEDVVVEEYAIFMTDFSSFAFDFVYLERPILYFVPDYQEFRCGLNAYRTLDLEFENAFGRLCLSLKEMLLGLEDILSNDCKIEKKYEKRMSNFFLYKDKGCCNRLYQYLIRGDI